MNVNRKHIKFIGNLILVGSEKTYDISQDISGLIITRGENATKPMYTLSCDLSQITLSELKYAEFVIVTLTIEEDTSDLKNWLTSKVVRNLVLQMTSLPDITIDDPDDDTKKTQYVMHGFEENHINFENKKRRSLNLRNVGLKQGMLKQVEKATKSGLIIDNMCMNKVDNTNIYNEIPIYSDFFLSSLKDIDEQYGLFRGGPAGVFLENGVLYIVCRNIQHQYKNDNPSHINNLNVFVYDKVSFSRNELTEHITGTPTIPNVYFQSEYVINNNCKSSQTRFGSKIFFYTENYNSEKSAPVEINWDIHKAYINTRSPLSKKETSTSSIFAHNPFSKERFESELKTTAVTTKLSFLDTSLVYHNYNTQYNVDFHNVEEKKYSGVFTAIASVITYSLKDGVNFSCDADILLKNISLDVREYV